MIAPYFMIDGHAIDQDSTVVYDIYITKKPRILFSDESVLFVVLYIYFNCDFPASKLTRMVQRPYPYATPADLCGAAANGLLGACIPMDPSVGVAV